MKATGFAGCTEPTASVMAIYRADAVFVLRSIIRTRTKIFVRRGSMEELTELLKQQMPIAMESYSAGLRKSGLVIVDEVVGFAMVGAGNLAPTADNPQVTQMIRETDQLHADAGFAEGGRALVIDDAAGEAGQDRRKSRATWSIRHFPIG